MKTIDHSKLTDDELLLIAQNKKSKTLLNAFIIGLLIGIVIYSVAKNTFGFLTIIPLFFIYKIINNNDFKSIEDEIKKRNLK